MDMRVTNKPDEVPAEQGGQTRRGRRDCAWACGW